MTDTTDREKLIKLLEHAESFSLEAYGKSPNLSECSLNIQYLRACILQAISNAKALRERLANDKTDREIMQRALEAMMDSMRVSGGISDKMFESVNAISERLAQPEPHIAVRDSNGFPDFKALHLRAKQKAEKEAALSWPEGNNRKKLQEELTDRYFYEYTTGLSTGRR